MIQIKYITVVYTSVIVVLLLTFGSSRMIYSSTNITGVSMTKAGMNSQTLRIVSHDVTDYHIADGKTAHYMLRFVGNGLNMSELSGYTAKKVSIQDPLSWKSETDTDVCSYYIEAHLRDDVTRDSVDIPYMSAVQKKPTYSKPEVIHPQSDTTRNFGKLFDN
jgi:hypothetical protein